MAATSRTGQGGRAGDGQARPSWRPVRWPDAGATGAGARTARSGHAAAGASDRWPGDRDSGGATSGPDAPDWLRPGQLLAHLAAELSAQLGLRLRVRLEEGDAALAEPALLGGIETGSGRLLLALDGDAAMELLAALFGSDRLSNPPETALLTDLAPDNAGWTACAALLRQAVARALLRAGAAEAVAAAPRPGDAGMLADPTRAAGAAAARSMALSLSGAGLQASLLLVHVPAPAVQPQPGAGQPQGEAAPPLPWARRIEAATRALPVPVTMELAERRVALAEVMQLAVGDLIPLPEVRTLTMKVAGQAWDAVPLAALGAPAADRNGPQAAPDHSGREGGRA